MTPSNLRALNMILWNIPKISLRDIISILALAYLVTGCGGGDNAESLFDANVSSAAANGGTSNNGSSKDSNQSQASNQPTSSKSSVGIVDTTIPTPPFEVIRTALYSSRVDLNWSSATDNVGVTQYRIYRDTVLLATLSADTLSYLDRSVSQDTLYTYGVAAGDAAGNWSTQKTLEVKTPVASVNGDVSLSWIAPTERESGAPMLTSELAGYEIKFRSVSEIAFTVVTIPRAETMTYVFRNLLGDYEFQIAAFDNNFVYSNFIALSPR
jgi:hypothetical protein